MSNVTQTNFYFHENISSTGVGAELNVGKYMDEMVVQVLGDPNSVTFEVQGKSQGTGAYVPLTTIDLNSLSVGTSHSGGHLLLVSASLKGLVKVRIEVTSIDGECSIAGRVVS